MNTQNINELENSQNSVLKNHNATLLKGIVKGYVNTEDSIPFTTIMGKFDKDGGVKIAQDLANAMDINILINRIETWYLKEESVLHLIYDIKPNYNDANQPVLEYPNLDERYGIKIIPQLSKKLKM